MSFPSSSDVSFHVGQRIPLTLDNRISTSRILAGRHSLALTLASCHTRVGSHTASDRPWRPVLLSS